MADRERTVAAVVVLGISFAATGCVTSEVTPIGRTFPSRPPNCPVEIFPATQPPYPYVNVASASARCHVTAGRGACIEQLRQDACQAGADTLYGFVEGRQGENAILSVTIARRVAGPPGPPGPPPGWRPPGPPPQQSGCNPPCSPGYQCQGAACIAVCNPPCSPGFFCAQDRTCQMGQGPAAPPPPPAQPPPPDLGAPPTAPPPPQGLPPVPDRASVGAALQSAADRVRQCVGPWRGRVTVGVIAHGSGRITSVTVLGPPFAGTPTGQCIQQAIGLASVPPFARPTFSVECPYNLP